MASNDSNELSGLNSPCWSLCLAPKCFFEPFQRKEEGRKEGQNGHVDLRARTSPQVKSYLFHMVQFSGQLTTSNMFSTSSYAIWPTNGLQMASNDLQTASSDLR